LVAVVEEKLADGCLCSWQQCYCCLLLVLLSEWICSLADMSVVFFVTDALHPLLIPDPHLYVKQKKFQMHIRTIIKLRTYCIHKQFFDNELFVLF
jgi:hypothetical protein